MAKSCLLFIQRRKGKYLPGCLRFNAISSPSPAFSLFLIVYRKGDTSEYTSVPSVIKKRMIAPTEHSKDWHREEGDSSALRSSDIRENSKGFPELNLRTLKRRNNNEKGLDYG
ncbi:hypothetical protein HI914_03174 [Erysiphe necator]|nr:hypothetical protein HI914_03174 [Erysiphe necator]